MSDHVSSAYQKSLELLKDLVTEAGFVAAFTQRANYHRVFARDGIISGLAALLSGDELLIGTFRNTLESLSETQDETGRIPSNVSVDKKSISYGKTVGRIDATLWYVIGACQYYLITKNKEFFDDILPSLRRAIFYLECLELNGRGLLYIPPGGDWADEYIINGYVLYDQLLYYLALKSFRKSTRENGELKAAIDKLRQVITINYFPESRNAESEYAYSVESFKQIASSHRPVVPRPSIYQTTVVDGHVDNFANSLLMHTDILDKAEVAELRQEINNRFLSIPDSILPAFHPVIDERSPYWPFLKRNFQYGFRNQPYEYHNGGQWPLVHGFYLASYKDDYAHELLSQFAKRLHDDNYTFPEYYHGQTGQPGGVSRLGFSAAAYVIAHQTVTEDKKLFIL